MDIEPMIALVRTAHAGQTDLMGRDYFEYHLKPVAQAAEALLPGHPEVVAAAWLHDIIEDTSVCVTDLQAALIPDEIIDAVISVTKRDGESYDGLITRACANSIGRWVKLADNTVNIANNKLLAESNPEKAAKLLAEKYLPARAQLKQACGLT